VLTSGRKKRSRHPARNIFFIALQIGIAPIFNGKYGGSQTQKMPFLGL
jgi:hypothetical protein